MGGYNVDLLPTYEHNLLKRKTLVYFNFLVRHFKEIRRPSAPLGPYREQNEV